VGATPWRFKSSHPHRQISGFVPNGMPSNRSPNHAPWLRALPIMRMMQSINGFLYDEEADLLLAATARALAMPGSPRAVVEIGSYRGKSTAVLGMAAKALHPDAKVYAIDPHDGGLSVGDETVPGESTFEEFQRNMAAAGLEEVVVPIKERSTDVRWESPIGLLFVDGLHDYLNVSRDFAHFDPWVVPGGLVAFHDYGKSDFPGVTTFVDEVVAGGGYLLVQRAGGLVVLEKL
jgi:predicted O-methyltransferase YrrM